VNEEKKVSKDVCPEFQKLLDVIHRLRAPGGCPWDREQTPRTLRPFIIEEAYELCDAIDRDDPISICEELGDLLLQVVLQTEIGSEAGRFDIADVCRTITAKLVRRHPHVFAGLEVIDSSEVLSNWETIKQTEKESRKSVLDGIPVSMPSLQKALAMGNKASRVGFDWPDAAGVREKLMEELEELDEILPSNNPKLLEDEFGDLLFAAANYGRHLNVNPEVALARACEKFKTRFGRVEQALKDQGKRPQDVSMEELEALWQKAKNQ